MCGIVGIINDNKSGAFAKELNVFKQMLIAGSLRGSHGTGIIAVDVDGQSQTRKIAGDPFSLLRGSCNKEVVEDWALGYKTSWRALIGHNRYATTGGHTTANAHPFVQGRYTMVHNGTLQSYGTAYSLKKFEVDSENFCYAMHEMGIREAISKTNGAIATVVYDEQDQVIHFYRNNERPLFVGFDKFIGKIVFASEVGMLNWICGREGWNQLKFQPLPVDTLYTVSINNIKEFQEEPLKSADSGWTGMGFVGGDYSSRGWKQKHKQPQQTIIVAEHNTDTSKGSDAKAVREHNKRMLASKLETALVLEDKSSKKPEGEKDPLEAEVEAKNAGNVIPLSRRAEFQRQREAKYKNSAPARPNSFQSVAKLNGIAEGQEIVFSPVDITGNGPHNKKHNSFLLEGRCEDSPKLQIRFWCHDQEHALSLAGASYLKAKIRTLLWYTGNDRSPEGAYDIAWVESPVPVSGSSWEGGSVH